MNMESNTLITSPYGFSSVSINTLEEEGASEYTLVSIAQDTSMSVNSFKPEMEICLKEIVNACMKSQRADNLLLRLCSFGSNVKEIHGFKRLMDCNTGDYDNCLSVGGMTPLNDAVVNALEAMNSYGANLNEAEFDINGILIVITDGDDNDSTNTINQVKQMISKISKDEKLESLVTILIGVNLENDDYIQVIENYKDEVGFTQFVGLKDADSKTLAKVANFVSQSISSQSNSLGTGGPSKSLSF